MTRRKQMTRSWNLAIWSWLLVALCCCQSQQLYLNPGAITAEGTLSVNSLLREYRLYVPASYHTSRKSPLVLVLHGGGGRADNIQKILRWNQYAEKEGFVVAYPQGIEKHWNDSRINRRYRSQRENVDDVKFLLTLISHLQSRLHIDSRRIYLFGISNGAMMAFRFACEQTRKIAAVAAVIGAMPKQLVEWARPSRPIPVLMINGTEDPLVPWEGGHVRFLGIKLGEVLSVPDTVKFWCRHNRCFLPPQQRWLPDIDSSDGSRIRCERYQPAGGGAEVVLYAVENGGHTWPSGPQYVGKWIIGNCNRDAETVEIVWNFFKRHALRAGKK